MNVLLDIMDLNEDLKGNYLVMDNCTIHKSNPMMRKIESRGYKLMYLPPYSPELNPIEQFWAILKGKLKRHKLLTEEKMSDRIAEACNAIPAEILYNFASHSKRQIIQCYNRTPV
jgi:transposase